MRRPGILVLALAGLTALLGSCGGGEETGVLAVAFRLDEGSPVMSAYVGDPVEDPFLLPAGRYYVEALNQDEVVVSRAVVDTDGGQAVGFPPTLGAAGGVADPPGAEPLITLANFLIDVELAKLTFLEIATGGFELTPFDPGVSFGEAEMEGLAGHWQEIATQEDAVLAALNEIERRASASPGVSYVRSRWAPPPDDIDIGEAKKRLAVLFTFAEQFRDPDPPEYGSVEYWEGWWKQEQEARNFQAEAYPPGMGVFRDRVQELYEKQQEWQDYAKDLVQGLPGAPGQARQDLEDKIRDDLEDRLREWGAEVPPGAVDAYVSKVVDDLAKTVPALAGTPAPVVAKPTGTATPEGTEAPEETATPTPDTGWIDGFVQGIADQWLTDGYSGIDVAVAADDLRQCLLDKVQGGAGRDEAIGECPLWVYEPQGTPEATETPAPEETETPAADETETPPEETEIPPEPTEAPSEPTETPAPEPTPTPEPKDLTAVGQWIISLPGLSLNSVTLRFNTAGGPVSGEGYTTSEIPPVSGVSCPPGTLRQTDDFEGTYSPETGEFGGTFTHSAEGSYYTPVFKEDTTQECEERPYGQAPTSGPWHATLHDGVVTGYRGTGESGEKFELTVGGQ